MRGRSKSFACLGSRSARSIKFLRAKIPQAQPRQNLFQKMLNYPAQCRLENKLYHLAIVATGLSVILTGVFMLSRVRTIFFPRNPYLFSDMTWGLMYVLHGLAGVGLIALVMMHVYFAVRPEKLDITKSMISGSMSREFYLQEHDLERWVIESSTASSTSKGAKAEVRDAG